MYLLHAVTTGDTDSQVGIVVIVGSSAGGGAVVLIFIVIIIVTVLIVVVVSAKRRSQSLGKLPGIMMMLTLVLQIVCFCEMCPV